MNGAIDSGSGSIPSASCVIVWLPASVDLVDLVGPTSAASQTSCASWSSVSCASRCRGERVSSIIVAEMREITSAPKGCCLLSIERTASGRAVDEVEQRRDHRGGAEVERDRVAALGRVARLDVDQPVVDDHRRDLPVRRRAASRRACARRRARPAGRSRRSRPARARGRRAGPPRRARPARGSASSPPAAGSRAGRRRRAPPSAASAAAGRSLEVLVRDRAAGQAPAVAQLVRRERARRRGGRSGRCRR